MSDLPSLTSLDSFLTAEYRRHPSTSPQQHTDEEWDDLSQQQMDMEIDFPSSHTEHTHHEKT